jgi:hypothetical protein
VIAGHTLRTARSRLAILVGVTCSIIVSVLVYAAESKSMLQVLCTDAVAKAPDVACAIAAAKEAYSNT